MRRTVALALVLLALAFPAKLAPGQVAEDDPSWNCHTMGNGVCGPVEYPLWERP